MKSLIITQLTIKNNHTYCRIHPYNIQHPLLQTRAYWRAYCWGEPIDWVGKRAYCWDELIDWVVKKAYCWDELIDWVGKRACCLDE